MRINSIQGRMNTEYLYYMAPNLGILHMKYGKEYVRSFPTRIEEQTLKKIFKEATTQLIHND